MPSSGSQTILCGLPIRFDTYSGCSHMCQYCFAQKKINLNNIRINETEKALRAFIEGKRTQETSWCDWDIPLHWGGLSDPFQPLEKRHRVSLECLKVFAETHYPFVVSTKGKLITDPEYLALLQRCNCVVQISAVCSKYDALEQGAPSFEERIKMIQVLSKTVPRVIVRIQPYMTEVHGDVMQNMQRFKAVGAYGVIVEGMKFNKKQPGLVKVGGDFAYDKQTLEQHFRSLKNEAHKYGLKFYCGENRLRAMGDSLTCCGIDGLQGFKPNEYNLCHILNGCKAKPTEKMKEIGTAYCFKAIDQTAAGDKNIRITDFNSYLLNYYAKKKTYIKGLFGK